MKRHMKQKYVSPYMASVMALLAIVCHKCLEPKLNVFKNEMKQLL